MLGAPGLGYSSTKDKNAYSHLIIAYSHYILGTKKFIFPFLIALFNIPWDIKYDISLNFHGLIYDNYQHLPYWLHCIF